MTISLIIPACDAEATLSRTLESVLRQTEPNWEAIIVADDLKDYQRFLSSKGFTDPRLRFASTGRHRSGCHHARNIGFETVTGDYITQLDADDEITPHRLAELLPLAQHYGAAADNLLMIDDETHDEIGRVMDHASETTRLSLQMFMTLNAPLVPLIRRDHCLPRVPGIEFSEDVIANIQLIDRIGHLPVTASSTYIYYIRRGSMANSVAASDKFERGYSDYINRLREGDGFGLTAENRLIACEGLITKRTLNRDYAEAAKREPHLTFSQFVKRKHTV